MTEPAADRPLPTFAPDADPAREPGTLSVLRGEAPVPLPLERIDYRAAVVDGVADVTLTQEFGNPFGEALEAVYTFPLAGGAAVRSFELEVAGRTIRAVVLERGEARRQYDRALDEGKRAGILEQERDNVFTIRVGNLPPGERATVRIAYCERLEISDGRRTSLRLPTVVAPRYVPGAPLDRENAGDGVEDDTDAVPDASRVTPPRLADGAFTRPEVSIEVTLSAPAGGIADLACSQHATATSFAGDSLTVRLSRADERANRDFVLRWRLATEAVGASLATYRHPEHGVFGMLTVAAPPAAEGAAARRDVLFLLDRSGSMQGAKMTSAARACGRLLQSLTPADRFAIAAFDTTVEWLGSSRRPFVQADAKGVRQMVEHLRRVEARGGTELDRALAEALEAVAARREHEGRMPVLVLVTDGEVANEHQVLEQLQRELGDTRLFAVGVDTAVNDALLRRMAALGRGTASLVEPGAALEETLAAVAREIGVPEVVDLAIEDVDAGVVAGATVPERAPDLFAGRTATVFLRLDRPGAVRLRGRRPDGTAWSQLVRPEAVELPAVAHLWARGRVGDLEDAYRIRDAAKDELKREIVALSLAHGIVTRFTAMLAVDEAEVANPDGTRRRVVQPVEMPDAWAEADARSLPGSVMPPVAYSVAAPAAPVMRAASPSSADAGDLAIPPVKSASRLHGAGETLFNKLRQTFGGRAEAAPSGPPTFDVLRTLAATLEQLRGAFEVALATNVRGAQVAARLEELRAKAHALATSANHKRRLAALAAFLEGECADAVKLLGGAGPADASRAAGERVAAALRDRWIPEVGRAVGGAGRFWEDTV